MRRPEAMRLDDDRCIHCELCAEIAPVILVDPARIPVTVATLEAMSACPTGAIVWCDEPEQARRAP